MATIDHLPKLDSVPPPPGGNSGLIDRSSLELVEPRAREVQLCLAQREYGRARAVIARAEREDRLEDLVDAATPLAAALGEEAPVKVLNALEDVGVATVLDLMTASPHLLCSVAGTSPKSIAGLLQQVLRTLVRREE